MEVLLLGSRCFSIVFHFFFHATFTIYYLRFTTLLIMAIPVFGVCFSLSKRGCCVTVGGEAQYVAGAIRVDLKTLGIDSTIHCTHYVDDLERLMRAAARAAFIDGVFEAACKAATKAACDADCVDIDLTNDEDVIDLT